MNKLEYEFNKDILNELLDSTKKKPIAHTYLIGGNDHQK